MIWACSPAVSSCEMVPSSSLIRSTANADASTTGNSRTMPTLLVTDRLDKLFCHGRGALPIPLPSPPLAHVPRVPAAARIWPWGQTGLRTN